MCLDLHGTLPPAPRHLNANKVIAWLPAGFISVRIHRTGGEPNVIRVLRDALAVLVAKQMDSGSAANGVVNVILIHEPIWRVMAQHEIDHVVDWIKHGLKWAKVKTIARIVLTNGPG